MQKEKLKELFIDKRLSQRSIAKEFNCSQSTVKYYIKKYGLVKAKSKKKEITKETTKVCSKCMVTKPASDFYLRKERENELTGYCKSCNSKDVIERMQTTKHILVELKGGKCQLCSFSEYIGALEFHHIDPKTKDKGMSRLIRGKINQKIIDEVNKCVLVCSNCHKMIHANLKKCPDLIIVHMP
jgi:predicted transcriptional regulator